MYILVTLNHLISLSHCVLLTQNISCSLCTTNILQRKHQSYDQDLWNNLYFSPTFTSSIWSVHLWCSSDLVFIVLVIVKGVLLPCLEWIPFRTQVLPFLSNLFSIRSSNLVARVFCKDDGKTTTSSDQPGTRWSRASYSRVQVQVNVTMEEPGVHVVTFQSCNDLGYMRT